MAKSLPLVVAAIAALFLSGCNEKNEEKNMIKSVDVEKVISTSALLTQENEHLNKVKETLLAGKEAAEANYAKMTEENAQKSALADKLLLEKSWNQQRKQARIITLDTLYAEIEQYRVENKITLIAHKTAIIAGDNSADISNEIVTRIKDKQVKYGSLPEVSTRDTAPESADISPAESEAATQQ